MNIFKSLKSRMRQIDIFDVFKILGIIFYLSGLILMISCFFL